MGKEVAATAVLAARAAVGREVLAATAAVSVVARVAAVGGGWLIPTVHPPLVVGFVRLRDVGVVVVILLSLARRLLEQAPRGDDVT